MKVKVVTVSLVVLFSLAGKVSAQPLLTLEEAIRIALENNYDIRISANNLEIDQQNVTLGNAGILPVVGANFTNNNSVQNSSQTQANGIVTERIGARNSNINYGVGLDWTIFDGFGMFARLDYLKQFEKLGEVELKQMIVTKVSDLIAIYYDLAQQQQQLKALDTIIDISQQRLTTAQNRFIIGKASKLEVLNAQVDLNTDTTNLLRQMDLYINTKVRLNEMLARDANTPFVVSDSIHIDKNMDLSELTQLAAKQNPQLLVAVVNKRLSELELKQIKANRYPVVGVNTGYTINAARSALGFATQSSGRGFTYGITARVNLFNGLQQNNAEKVAHLVIKNSQLEIDKVNQEINTQMAMAFQTYLTNFRLADMEEKNVLIAQQNLEISLEKFNTGTIAAVEFRTAQLNFVNAKQRLSNALFQAKLSEISLQEIAGNIRLQ